MQVLRGSLELSCALPHSVFELVGQGDLFDQEYGLTDPDRHERCGTSPQQERVLEDRLGAGRDERDAHGKVGEELLGQAETVRPGGRASAQWNQSRECDQQEGGHPARREHHASRAGFTAQGQRNIAAVRQGKHDQSGAEQHPVRPETLGLAHSQDQDQGDHGGVHHGIGQPGGPGRPVNGTGAVGRPDHEGPADEQDGGADDQAVEQSA